MPEITLQELEKLFAERHSVASCVQQEGRSRPYCFVHKYYKLESMEPLLRNPTQKVGHPKFNDIDSFCAFFNEQKRPESRIYMRSDTLIQAVIDAHETEHVAVSKEGVSEPVESLANWGRFRADLTLTETPAWKAWWQSNGKTMQQREFAEFISDHRQDITSPDGAEFLDMVRSIKASAKHEITGVVNEKDEQAETHYVFETRAQTRNEKAEPLELPSQIVVELAVYEGQVAIVPCVAKIGWQINGGKLFLSYAFRLMEEFKRACIDSVRDKIAEITERKIWIGSPE